MHTHSKPYPLSHQLNVFLTIGVLASCTLASSVCTAQEESTGSDRKTDGQTAESTKVIRVIGTYEPLT